MGFSRRMVGYCSCVVAWASVVLPAGATESVTARSTRDARRVEVTWGGAGSGAEPGATPAARVPEASPPATAAPPVPAVPPVPSLPPVSPVAAGDLQASVSPAVVALVVSSPSAPARVSTGVVVTASGLILASRRAVAPAIEGRGNVTMVRGGPRGRVGAHEIGDSVPTRLIGVAADLDLVLLEALPAGSVFYPHLPIVRRSVQAGAPLLAVGHDRGRGLWTAALVSLGDGPAAKGGPPRWSRTIAGDAAAVTPGMPLVDALGRIAAVVATPDGEEARAIDADALWRFALSVDAPGLRFAGIPPNRRTAPGPVRGSSTTLSAGAGPTAAPAPGAGAGPAEAAHRTEAGGTGSGLARAIDPDAQGALEMPRVVSKGHLDRHFQTARGGADPKAADQDVAAHKGGPAEKKGPAETSFLDAELALSVAGPALDRHAAPATLKIDIADAPDRGAMDAPITVAELGDYHAPQTRDVEAVVRALAEGRDARVRVFWKDADLGDGAGYQIPARAAQAAREQDEFWAMHDRLLKDPAGPTAKDARQTARALGLDLPAFDQVFDSDGVLSTLEGEGEKARRLPVLATPTFIVNGRVVDGGTAASAVLLSAVDEEVALAAAKLDRQPVAERESLLASRLRRIEGGRRLPGTPFDPEKLGRGVAEAAARRAAAKARKSLAESP